MTRFHLAVALEGAVFDARHWIDLVTEAERGLLDFVTIEDDFGLDAVLLAARLAPVTSHVGLVPVTGTTHTEPFHVSIGIASLDHAGRGRAGWLPRISPLPADADHVGRRALPPVERLYAEAADAVEVVRRLWDSWEDDAEIRDAATGRFIDRDKVHYIDFEGEFFSVRGPSITPRPPQGQPLVAVSARDERAYGFAASSADVVLVAPATREEAAEALAHFPGQTVLADVDAELFAGNAGALADHLQDLREAGLDGFRLRPGALPEGLTAITRELVPELQRRGVFRTAYEATTLRGHFGLDRPAGRYTRTVPAP